MTRTVEDHLESALDFLRALSPWDGIFPADYRRAFIIRGVGSASYRLIPSAFREGTSLRQVEGTVTAPLPTVGSQIGAELSTLWEAMTLTVGSYGDRSDDIRQPLLSRDPRPCVI